MQRIFVLKDKLVFTMKKCMVFMAFVNMILEHGGVHTKLVIYPLLLTPDHKAWSRFKALALPFYPMVSYARSIIFIFLKT